MNRSTLGFLLVSAGLILGIFLMFPSSTPSIWELSFPPGIFSNPVRVGQNVFFVQGEDRLYSIAPSGKVEAQAKLSDPLGQPLVALPKAVVAIGKQGRLTALSHADLKTIWHKELQLQSGSSSIAVFDNRLFVKGTPDSVWCLDGNTGNLLWESHPGGEIHEIVAGKEIFCLSETSEVKNKVWRISAISPIEGAILWKFPRPVEAEKPHEYTDYLVFCDASGTPVIVDRLSGEEKYRHPVVGLKLLGIAENYVLFLALGGSRIESLSFLSGNSWSATLPSPLLNVFGWGDSIVIVDGRSVRCVNAETGLIRWQKELGKTFNAFSAGNGICITYRTTSISLDTSFGCIDPENGKTIWVSCGMGIFWSPFLFDAGDMVFSQTGKVALMPKGLRSPEAGIPDGNSEFSASGFENCGKQKPQRTIPFFLHPAASEAIPIATNSASP